MARTSSPHRAGRAGPLAKRLAVGLGAGAAAAVVGCLSLKADVVLESGGGDDSGVHPDVLVDAAPGPDGAAPTDFVVDPSGATPGSFPTITAALAAANASAAEAKTIHVLPGTYGAGVESFPLVLRGGVSIEGAGSDGGTSIVGLGSTAFPAAPSSPDAAASATIVTGDTTRTTRIAHLALASPQAAQPGYEGIVCDRGTASLDGGAPNLVLDDVRIDGFEIGVRALAIAQPVTPGCNVRVTRSTIADGATGVLAQGATSGDGGTPLSPVSVELGDGTPDGGNTFSGFSIRSGPLLIVGAGLHAMGAIGRVVVSYNRFASSDLGVWLEQGGAPDVARGAQIDHNDFGPLQNVGVAIEGAAVVASLTDNTFHAISMSQEAQTAASSIFSSSAIILDPGAHGVFGGLLDVRRNTIVGCDIGVHIRGTLGGLESMSPDDAARIDFGTAASPGNNVFRCNSAPRYESNGSGYTYGGDVFLSLRHQDAGSPVTLSFEGNAWDHAPPSTESGVNSSTTGIDALTVGGTLDVGDAGVSTLACPAGNVPGP